MKTTEQPIPDKDDQVRHPNHGIGSVVAHMGETTVVRFLHGIEECETASLVRELTVPQAVERPAWDAPLRVLSLGQAAAIRSVNDAWGVFSRSRIALLPHQLWVCRQVNSTWPTRWLVADDVGLGKTIEAGLILMPLLSKRLVRRLLILCPAGLVDQWQERLRTMFDIRVGRYTPAADTSRSDFWGTHHQVIASLQTLRAEHTDSQKARLDRFFNAEPWDLLIVDEAHHLNADEETGPTLAYKLVQRMVEQRRVASVLFFTGTPHRGKNYGFLSLLRLLQPERFDPKEPLDQQLPRMREVMIRNNKQNVTDLQGKLLFKPPRVDSATYAYSDDESAFYQKLTEFIITGKAYANSLGAGDQRMVTLVLIAMQKLASSSVAAIRRAFRGRLERIRQQRVKTEKLETELARLRATLEEYQEHEKSNAHEYLADLEERVAQESVGLMLMEDEEPRLAELVEASDRVREETKIKEILELLETRFTGRSVLFFTEYKATQALLMSALMQRFGDQCVTFINGDDRLEGVIDSDGKERRLEVNRDRASDRFNGGEVRFLISTEAGGEGRDLQESCHCLIHVDLPWNPMRLHQRVGRINRYGQSQRVEVLTLRNPDTVESRIWEKLNEKIARINQALAHAMDEPEDLLQLVLGMVSPSLFRELFSEAQTIPSESLASWFDKKAATFGGQDAIDTVRQMVGHCARFDFQQVSDDLPQVDLPALQPFFEAMLALNSRRPARTQNTLTFHTPEAWLGDPAIRHRYEDVGFDRSLQGRTALDRVLGVGHRLVDKAIEEALEESARVATIASSALRAPLVVMRIRDRVTGETVNPSASVVGVAWDTKDAGEASLLRDWVLLEKLNELTRAPGVARSRSSHSPEDVSQARDAVVAAQELVEARLQELDIPYRFPLVEPLVLLWPAPRGRDGAGGDGDPDIDDSSAAIDGPQQQDG